MIGVIGTGIMGKGITEVFLNAGFSVYLVGKDELQLTQCMRDLRARIKTKVELSVGTDYALLKDAELVVEAIPEDLKLKKGIFKKLDSINKSGILATNTSSLSVTEIASSCRKPERVLGMHFMNPARVMQLVEIVKGKKTSETAYQKTKQIAEKLGKATVLSADTPGSLVNRVLFALIQEGMVVYESKAASKEDIDKALKNGANLPMGPLELADFIGLDVCLDILTTLHKRLGDHFKPPRILKNLVAEGKLGRKSGEGNFKYN